MPDTVRLSTPHILSAESSIGRVMHIRRLDVPQKHARDVSTHSMFRHIVSSKVHDNWVAYSGYGAAKVAQTCRNQSNLSNSRKLLRVILKFETKILL